MLKSVSRAGLLAALVFAPACRKRTEAAGGAAGEVPVIASALEVNAMRDAPQGLLASRAGSPVHWQHWEPAVLRRAGEARRLVFALIGSAQYPGCVETLDAIDRDPALVARLNGDFVPVLADTELCREAALAAGMLSQDLRQPVSFPFILVLSPEANEVTFRPVAYVPGRNLRELFEGATDLISRMWEYDPAYVTKDSRAQHEQRVKRLPRPDPAPASPEERDELLSRTGRKLANLYDEELNTVFGTGGLLPLGMLQCLASTSLDPKTPPDTAARAREAAAAFSTSVLQSAMVDPLDGGLYSNRRGNSWELPLIQRTCMTQARAARALVMLHGAIGDPRALEVALGAVRFAEEQFGAQNGLFATQRQPAAVRAADWLWTKEQVEAALSPEEAELWIELCDIKGMGNLSFEADPNREFFRLNSLGFRSGPARGDAATAALLESGRKKLLKARQDRMPDRAAPSAASAAPSFRMVSAYAALFTATGDPVWREKALSLAELARRTFSDGPLLLEQSSGGPDAVRDARAFTYALAIQAALDLAEITLDERWRLWAGDLSSTVSELFVDPAESRLREVRAISTPLTLPLEDRLMLFDDSTAGLMRMNLARLAALGQPPPPSLLPWLSSLPEIEKFPVVLTDSILAASFSRSRVIVELPADASAEWREAACRLPLDRVARRFGKEGEVSVVNPDGSRSPVAAPAGLPGSAPAPVAH